MSFTKPFALSLFGLAALVASNATADWQTGNNGWSTPNPQNQEALARLNRILERSSYDGVTPSGFPCHMDVARQFASIGGLPGQENPLSTMMFSVREPNRGVPPIQGINGELFYPVWVNVGSFSLGRFSPPDTIVSAQATDTQYTLKVYSKPEDYPGVRFLESTTTTLVFTADQETGMLKRVAGEMVYFDGATDRSILGNFSCGRAN